MNIQAEKLAIMKLILETENTSVLESIKNIFKKRLKNGLLGNITPLSKGRYSSGNSGNR